MKGKRHYFGKRWGDPYAALSEYESAAADLHAVRSGALTVEDGLNLFLGRCDRQVSAGKLAEQTFDSYRRTARRIADVLGRSNAVAGLRPKDFSDLASKYIYQFDSPITQGSEVTRVKAIFHWLYENEETLYNRRRRHQTLGYKSPNQFEADHAPATAA